MEPETEQNESKLTLSKLCVTQRPPLELQDWMIEQVGILAVAFGEPVTPERLRIYAADLLSDLSREQLETALTRAMRELKFFPKIAELRNLAGANAAELRDVEAEAAWVHANEHLRQWGVDGLPIFSSGKRIEAPPLPPRIGYALRRIGGLRALNQGTSESRPFMYKDFCKAYNQAPMAEQLAPKLQEMFPENKLLQVNLGEAKPLTSDRNMDATVRPPRFGQPAGRQTTQTRAVRVDGHVSPAKRLAAEQQHSQVAQPVVEKLGQKASPQEAA